MPGGTCASDPPIRALLADLLGERSASRRSDRWALYYQLPGDAKEALAVLEGELWDERHGVEDDAAPWRAMRGGARPSLALEAEAAARAQALQGERTRRAVQAAEAARKRAGQPPLVVSDTREAIMTRYARSEMRRLAESRDSAGRQG